MNPLRPFLAARSFAILSLCAALSSACSNGNGNGATNGSNGTNGTGTTGGTGGPFTFVQLDANPGKVVKAMSMAVGPNDRVGVVYFQPNGGTSLGQANQDIKYVEWNPSSGVGATSIVRTVQQQDGLSLAFGPDGLPAVGHVGGGVYFYDGGSPSDAGAPVTSLAWLQSQAAVSYQQTDGTWKEEVCMADSTAGGSFMWPLSTSADPIVNLGFVVGLWPSLVFTDAGASMAFRDVHFGQFPKQDWGGSNVKLCQGGPDAGSWKWSAPLVLDALGGFELAGFGLHNQMVVGAGGALAMVSSGDPTDQGAVDGPGLDVTFVAQNVGTPLASLGSWTAPINPFGNRQNQSIFTHLKDTQSGPALVYDPQLGYSVAAVDATSGVDALYYVNSADGQNWDQAIPVYQNGSGGFFPSMAVDAFGTPHIAFTICSLSPGVQPNAGACDTTAELDLAVLTGSGWTRTTVFPGNVYLPKLAFLSTGKRVIAFWNYDTGSLNLAVEK